MKALCPLLAVLLAAAIPPPLFAAASIEAGALQVLASSSDLNAKAQACHELAMYGGPATVPALAALLDHEQLSDYARIGLEANPAPAAAKALREALRTLEGRRLAGVINSLGIRRDHAAVPELRRLAFDAKRGVAAEAIAALGVIATPDAAKVLQDALRKGSPDVRTAAGHAALAAAERLAKEKQLKPARNLLDAVVAAVPDGPVATVAKQQAAALRAR